MCFIHMKIKITINIIDDEVILSTSNLIHGSRASIETLEIISKEGLIASEFYDNFNPNKKERTLDIEKIY